MLHPAAKVRCTVDAIGATGAAAASVTVTLADLERSPLDVVALADAGDERARTELEQRFAAHALADPAGFDSRRHRGLSTLRLERHGQALVGEQRRVDTAREVAEVVSASRSPP